MKEFLKSNHWKGTMKQPYVTSIKSVLPYKYFLFFSLSNYKEGGKKKLNLGNINKTRSQNCFPEQQHLGEQVTLPVNQAEKKIIFWARAQLQICIWFPLKLRAITFLAITLPLHISSKIRRDIWANFSIAQKHEQTLQTLKQSQTWVS